MAEKNEIRVKITLDGAKEFSSQLKTISASVKTIGKDFSELGKAVESSLRQLVKVGAVAAGAAAGLVALTAKNAEAAEQTQNLSTATGVSVEQLQTLSNIADTSGVSQEQLAKSLKRLTLNMSDFRDPTSQASKELTELDASLASALATAPNVGVAFDRVKEALSKVTDEQKRAEIATTVFGKSGINLLPILTQTTEEYNKQREQLKRLGVILNATKTKSLAGFDDAFDDAKLALKGLGLEISATLAPALTRAAQAFTDFIVNNRERIAELVQLIAEDGINGFTRFFKSIAENNAFAQLSGQIQNFIQSVKGLIGVLQQLASSFVQGFQAVATALNPIANFFGLQGGGQQLILTVAVLQFLGVLKVLQTALSLLVTTLKIGLIPQLISFALIIPNLIIKNIGLLIASFGGLRQAFLATVLIMNINLVKLGTTLTGLRTLFTLTWTAALGPIGLIVAGIGLISFGIFKLVQDTIGWDNALKIARGTIENLPVVVNRKVDEMKRAFSAFGELAKTVAERIASQTGAAFASLPARASAAATSIGGFFRDLGTNVTLIFTGWGTALSSAFSQSIAQIRQNLANFFSGISSFFSSLISSITNKISEIRTNIRGLAESARGLIPGQQPRFGPGFAEGGLVSGPGSTTSDSIPAMLSNREFVINASAVKKYGVGFMNALNNGVLQLRGFAEGGLVSGGVGSLMSPALAVATAGASGRPLQLMLPSGGTIDTTVNDDTARKLQRSLRRSASVKSSTLPRWYK